MCISGTVYVVDIVSSGAIVSVVGIVYVGGIIYIGGIVSISGIVSVGIVSVGGIVSVSIHISESKPITLYKIIPHVKWIFSLLRSIYWCPLCVLSKSQANW